MLVKFDINLSIPNVALNFLLRKNGMSEIIRAWFLDLMDLFQVFTQVLKACKRLRPF